MKNIMIAASVAIINTVSAHSWIECTDHDNSEILSWMKGNSTLSPPVIIDPAMPWYSYLCKGWPRNKANPGNWIDESTNYIWNIAANSWNGGSYHPADTHACPANQRTPTYQDNAPMTTAAPGGMIRLRYGGNGHTRGYNAGFAKGPGNVTVYWKGSLEQEITDISEFTPQNALQTNRFDQESFSYPADTSITTPSAGLVDKGNWMELNLPKGMAAGRHMMVWVWYYNDAPQWSTCFDVMISGSASNPISQASAAVSDALAVASANVAVATKAAAAAPEDVAAIEPVLNDAPADAPTSSPTPTPTPMPPALKGAATTTTEWFTEWFTDYVEETPSPRSYGRRHAHKRHPRQF